MGEPLKRSVRRLQIITKVDILKAIGFVVGFILLAILGFAAWFMFQTRPRRRREPGFEFIFVNDDGSARELDADEHDYLNTKFHPADGARPYIKFRYESLTPDGRISGYLRRRQLPARIKIDGAPYNAAAEHALGADSP